MSGLPKVELHLHRKGGTPAFIAGLARVKHLDISGVFDAAGNYRYKDFWDFLKVYEAATSALQSPRDYQRLVLAVLEESAKSGVVYSETFLSPDFCGGRDVGHGANTCMRCRKRRIRLSGTLGSPCAGSSPASGISGPRRRGKRRVAPAETAGDWIVGFGIAGDEKIGAPRISAGPSTARGRRG